MKKITQMIDHTLLAPDATEARLRILCEEAKTYRFASVCVSPGRVALCAALLKDSGIPVCTVIGFPSGTHAPEVKAFEAAWALSQGAGELDMVLNIGALKEGDDELVLRDIGGVCRIAAGRAIVKVILETCLLTDEEKQRACRLAGAAGADFVKTSTGFSKGGATVEDIALLRSAVGPDMGVKASGGVRTLEDARRMVSAGATRIGASAGVAIAQAEALEGVKE